MNPEEDPPGVQGSLEGEPPFEPDVTVYTDGCCLTLNGLRHEIPDIGGYGATFQDRNGVVLDEMTEAFLVPTDNNRMEIRAASEAIRRLPEGLKLLIVTDSEYLHDLINEKLAALKRRKWKNRFKKTPDALEEIKLLDEAMAGRVVQALYVEAHGKDPRNQRADQLARQGAEKARRILKDSPPEADD